jgi:hypothetical protein
LGRHHLPDVDHRVRFYPISGPTTRQSSEALRRGSKP